MGNVSGLVLDNRKGQELTLGGLHFCVNLEGIKRSMLLWKGPVRTEGTKLFFTLTVKNAFAQLFFWMEAQRQLALITQTDAIAEQLQLDREPMQGKGIFNNLCFKLLVLDRIRPAEEKSCTHHSSPRKLLIVRFFFPWQAPLVHQHASV